MQTPKLLQDFLQAQALGALVITRHANFAWLTGGRGFIGTNSDFGAAQVLITPSEMFVIANNIEQNRLIAEELSTCWEVRSYPWWEDGQPARLVQSLAGTGALGADGPFPGARDVGGTLAPLRWTLSASQQAMARQLGRDATEALETVCRSFNPGESEAEIAAQVGAALIRRGIDPIVRLVAGDERAARWRHPLPTAHTVYRYALVAMVGQRTGLAVSATRLVHFGPVPDGLRRRHAACAAVDAAMIRATVPGAAVKEIITLAQRQYAAAGFPDEWQLHHQGGLIAYASREYRATPTTAHQAAKGQMYAWNPSIGGDRTVGGVKSEDTVLVTDSGPEVITATGNWPEISVAGFRRPDILVR